MLTVVCLNWHNYLGRGREYVQKLLNGVTRNISEPFDFNEITERDLPADTRTGWWKKASVLQAFDGPATKLFLDLDVVVCSNLDALIAQARTDREVLWMRDDFSYSLATPRNDLPPDFVEYLGGPGTCQSSVMLWHKAPDLTGFDALMTKVHGDQNALTKLLWKKGGIKMIPNEFIKSYKYHPGESAPIVAFHGQPKPHEVTDQYITENWR